MNDFSPFRPFKKDISITFMSGPLDGKKLTFGQPPIGDERIITIGRREGCDIHIPSDNQISRLHARVGCVSVPTTSGDAANRPFVLSFWIEDGGSRNGTFIEREPDPVAGRVNLRPGTLFRVGRTWLRLDIPLSYED
jgi:pSer/pThr/pTyr-binding forkhead associated (FHA) protein